MKSSGTSQAPPTRRSQLDAIAVRVVVLVVGIAALASCAGSPATSSPAVTAATTPTATITPPSGPALAQALAGPFATLDAYCAGRGGCARGSEGAGPGAAGPYAEVAVITLTDPDDTTRTCAVALRTAAGWFVGAPSADACEEPGYIDLGQLTADAGADAVAIELAVHWHTNNYDDEAGYTLVSLCDLQVTAPACTPVFVGRCEHGAPAGDCGTAAYALTWKVDGNVVAITASATPGDHARALVGTHRLR